MQSTLAASKEKLRDTTETLQSLNDSKSEGTGSTQTKPTSENCDSWAEFSPDDIFRDWGAQNRANDFVADIDSGAQFCLRDWEEFRHRVRMFPTQPEGTK